MFIENIIIGSGPAGIQLGYFYEKNNISYIILERTNHSGDFFDKFPHTKELISINKKHTGNTNTDFNLRHDWNSLLNDEEFYFTNYSDDYYPKSYDLYKYLNDFKTKFNIKIEYNTDVKIINKLENTYEIIISNNAKYVCKNLIVATGLSLPNMPENITLHVTDNNIKHYGNFPKNYFLDKNNLNKYINKKLLILGSGNSSYELANALNPYCSHIIILGSQKKFSISSHYVGDIRSIYMKFLDTFHLKSLNGIDKFKKNKYLIIQNDDINSINYKKYKLCEHSLLMSSYYTGELEYFDEIIFCTGWKFDSNIFNFDIDKIIDEKLPKISYNYESTNNKNLFFIGSLMQSHDYKISSGGFIHGFRYLIYLFMQLNNNINFNKTIFNYDYTFKCYDDIAKHIYYRINNASSLYQLHSVLLDMFYYNSSTKEIIYYNDITFNCISNHKEFNNINTIFHTIQLKYGNHNYDLSTLGDFNKNDPIFLHLELDIYYKKNNIIDKIDTIIFEEDLISSFTKEMYYNKIRRILQYCNLII